MILASLIGGFGGGLVRGLVGFLKYQFSYKNTPFNIYYFFVTAFISGIIGMLVAESIKEMGFSFQGSFTSALSFIVGYAGGDFIENIYKIIIKKSSLFSEEKQ